MAGKILIIEDDEGVRFFLEEALKEDGYEVVAVSSFEEAEVYLGGKVDLLILDIMLPGLDGLSAIDRIKGIDKTLPIIVITAYGTKKNALEAVERGAVDFFIKPIPLQELKIVVKRTLGRRLLQEELESKRREWLSRYEFEGVIGASPAMKEIFKTVQRIADKDLSILITGETGVGKEVIAELIHRLSGRKGEFVVVNCASIPENLLESELFGYDKGAFTGATKEKAGKFELANKGTIVLDEIGEIGINIQAKLLRAIEKKEIERLGGTAKKRIDVRVIGITNRPIERAIEEGRFREDLYHRISQIHIHVPPLRERKEDLEVLIEKFLFDLSKEKGVILKLDRDARGLLLEYFWPGNIRELINVLKRAAFLSEGDLITLDDLPLYLRERKDRSLEMAFYEQGLDERISKIEKEMIIEALRKTEKRQVDAAKLLGIKERSLWYRIKKYGIKLEEI